MVYQIYPEYKGRIKKAILPDMGEGAIASSVDELAESLRSHLNPEIAYIPLSKIGNSYSLWVRDPAIFLGYNEATKPVALMTEDRVLHSCGSHKDIEDSRALREYLEAANIDVKYVPFFVIGGDCLITEKHAVLGWATPQVTGWAYGNYESGIDAIKRGLERFGLEPLLIDDVRELNENTYHDRRFNGFFHLDTVSSFIENQNGGITAVVSQPLPTYGQNLEDDIKYTDHASELLAQFGYSVSRAPAIVSNNSLWSPTNISIDGERRTIFISNSFDRAINRIVEELYGGEGYTMVTVDIKRAVQEARAGVRCMNFLIKV